MELEQTRSASVIRLIPRSFAGARSQAVVHRPGCLEEHGHLVLRRAGHDAVPEVEDVLARAAGLGDIGAHSLPDLLRASEEDGRVDVPLDLCLF